MSIFSVARSNIRAELARRDFSQADLARAVGKNPVSLSRQLSGQQEFKLSELEKIANFLDQSVIELLEDHSRSTDELKKVVGL